MRDQPGAPCMRSFQEGGSGRDTYARTGVQLRLLLVAKAPEDALVHLPRKNQAFRHTLDLM